MAYFILAQLVIFLGPTTAQKRYETWRGGGAFKNLKTYCFEWRWGFTWSALGEMEWSFDAQQHVTYETINYNILLCLGPIAIVEDDEKCTNKYPKPKTMLECSQVCKRRVEVHEVKC